MYQAAQRFGFQGGQFEPACGIGHFIGLAEEMLRQASITGIEIDPVTARIAKASIPTPTFAGSRLKSQTPG